MDMELIISESSKWAVNFKTWLVKALNALIEARQKEANRRIAMMQLYAMSDRDLRDIGINRGDIRRVVNEE
jgi:uncharacterized protein YjiS (DUF1127 family)